MSNYGNMSKIGRLIEQARKKAKLLTAQHSKSTSLRNTLNNTYTDYTKFRKVIDKLRESTKKEDKIEKDLYEIYWEISDERRKWDHGSIN